MPTLDHGSESLTSPEFVLELDRLLAIVAYETAEKDPRERDLALESKSIVDLFKTIVNEISDQFGGTGIGLDETTPCLQRLVRIIDIVLHHGLYDKKNGSRLTFRKIDLWELLSEALLESGHVSGINSIQSINNMDGFSKGSAKIRPWIKFSLMNQSIGDSLSLFVGHYGNDMAKYYQKNSCLVSDNCCSIINLLHSLRAFEFHLCLRTDSPDADRNKPLELDPSASLVDRLQLQNVGLELDLRRIEEAQIITVQQNSYYAEQNQTLSDLCNKFKQELKELDKEHQTLLNRHQELEAMTRAAMQEYQERIENLEKELVRVQHLKDEYRDQILEYKKILAAR